MNIFKENFDLNRLKNFISQNNPLGDNRYSKKFSLENMRKKYSKNLQTSTDSQSNDSDEGVSWDRTKDWAKSLFADKDGVSAGENFGNIINLPRKPAIPGPKTQFGGLDDF